MPRRALTPESALELRRRIGACLGCRTLLRAGFAWPVLLPFYERFAGLTPAEALGLVAAFAFGRVAFEGPARWLGGRVGRRMLVVGASAGTAVGAGAILVGGSIPAFVLGEVLLGAAAAAGSVALPGLLVATLADFGQEEDEVFLERRARIVEMVFGLATIGSSGLLLWLSTTAPYVLTLVTATAALTCAVLLDEPRSPWTLPSARERRAALREIGRIPALARAIVIGGLAAALSLAVRFAQQPYLEAVSGSVVWLGLVAAATEILRFGVDSGTGDLRQRRGGPALWMVLGAVPVFAMAALRHVLVTPLLLLRGAEEGLRGRDLDRVVGAVVSPAHRPAASTAVTWAERLGELVGAGLLAGLALALGLASGLALLGVGALVLAGMVAWLPTGAGPTKRGRVEDESLGRTGAAEEIPDRGLRRDPR